MSESKTPQGTVIDDPLTLEGFEKALRAAGVELGLMERETSAGYRPSYIYGHMRDIGGPLVDVERESPPPYAAFLDYIRLAAIPDGCLTPRDGKLSRLVYTRSEFVSLALASWIATRIRKGQPKVYLLPTAQLMDAKGSCEELEAGRFMVRLWASLEWHQTQNPWFPDKEAP